jgi:surfeit locus 1 family protein
MTSERPSFPIGLTLAAAAAIAIMAGLGVWQLQRLDWKHEEAARIAALRNAPPQPIGPVLARIAHAQNVDFTRVAADCLAGAPAPAIFHPTTDNGDWIARALAACRLAGSAYDGVMIDRGFLTASRGSTATPTAALPPPVHVVGVLFAKPQAPAAGLARPAPVVLSVERETPTPPGVTPAPYDAAANDSLRYVGAYAPTWFGLAGALACVYAAMLWRRYHPKR